MFPHIERRGMESIAHSIQAYVDDALNDSDKTITVPDKEVWQLFGVWVQLATTATGGNRQLVLEISDENDVEVFAVPAGAVIADNATVKVMFGPELPHLTSAIANTLTVPIPLAMLIPQGWKIRVYDSADIDAAADDLKVRVLHYKIN